MNYRKGRAKTAPILSVPIVRSIGGQYAVDRQMVEEIFCDESIAQMKVVIISMCGSIHCGKSLMLNYFYDHLLRNKNGPSPRNNDTPRRCFDWGNGIKTQKKTVGIYISRKPIIYTSQGEQLAVFLLDSEGMSIRAGPLQQFLFNLVTLLSSVQIVNVEKEIQDRDIYPLKPFFQAYDVLKDCVQDKLFENHVMFVVRDCANTLTCKLGHDENKQYLSKSFQNGYKRTVFEKLKRAFSDVDCFIMPHPGSNAIVKPVKNEFRGTYGELNDSFVLYLRELMNLILARNKLVLKYVNGKALSCAEFAEYIGVCQEALSRDSQTTLISLFAHTRNQPLITKCFVSFKDSLKRAIQKNASDDEEFSRLWDDQRAVIMNKFFEKSLDIPLDDRKNEYRIRFQHILDDFKDEARTNNDKFYTDCQFKNEKALKKCKNTYQGEFQSMVVDGQTDGRVVRERHESAKTCALRIFDRTVKEGGDRFVNKYREELLHTMHEILEEKLVEIAHVELEGNSTGETKSVVVGCSGGNLDHDICSLKFPTAFLLVDTQVAVIIVNEDDAWPSATYDRKAPIISIVGGDQPIRKQVKCTIPCWHISFSTDAKPEEILYVMQKKKDVWTVIHHENLGKKMSISFKLNELSAVTLALKARRQSEVHTRLYLDAEGNFKAFFFDLSHIGLVNDAAKAGRCMIKSDMNALSINNRDEIQVLLSDSFGAGVESRQFLGEEINGMKSFTFCGPDVQQDETKTRLEYEIKVNGKTKVLDRFRANFNNPGRPDTAHNGTVLINRTNAVGDYLTVSTNLE